MFMEYLAVYNQTIIPVLFTPHQVLVILEVGLMSAS